MKNMKITTNYKNINSCIHIDTGIIGPTVSIFSGIHGNEVSGIYANTIFLDKLSKGDLKINCGKINLVLEANEEAIKINDREVNKNMNRLFRDDIEYGTSYEEQRAKELKNLLKESDYHLDLHSTSGPSIPFLYSEMQNFEIAKKMGVSHVVGGWGELDGGIVSGDTENYVNNLGGYGFTFEAGDHNSIDGGKNAYQIILNFLSILNIIDKSNFKHIGEKQTFFKLDGVYIAKYNNFKYAIDIDNFQRIKKGTLIGEDNLEKIYAEFDMILVMPKTQDIIKKGIEVFFIGKEIK